MADDILRNLFLQDIKTSEQQGCKGITGSRKDKPQTGIENIFGVFRLKSVGLDYHFAYILMVSTFEMLGLVEMSNF